VTNKAYAQTCDLGFFYAHSISSDLAVWIYGCMVFC